MVKNNDSDDNSTVVGTFNDIVDGIGKVKPRVKFKRNKRLKPKDKVKRRYTKKAVRERIREHRNKKKFKPIRNNQIVFADHIVDKEPKDFKYVDYEYLKKKVAEWEILSWGEYKLFIKKFKPPGFPSVPHRIYKMDKLTDFLPVTNFQTTKIPYAVNKDMVLDFWEMAGIVSTYKYKTCHKYMYDVATGKLPYGKFRVNPHKKYENFVENGGWKVFLGSTAEALIYARKHLKNVLVVHVPDESDLSVVSVHIHTGAQAKLLELLESNHITPLKMYVVKPSQRKLFRDIVNEQGSQIGNKRSKLYKVKNINNLLFEFDSFFEPFVFDEKVVHWFNAPVKVPPDGWSVPDYLLRKKNG